MTEIQNSCANYNPRLAEIITRAADDTLARWEEDLLFYLKLCGSPIEMYFLAALYGEKGVNPYEMVFCGVAEAAETFCLNQHIYIYQQANIGKYQADFLIHDFSIPKELEKPGFIVVECDGHDYHERTSKQAAHDKKRDRYFQLLGYKVLRFTGSELYQDPNACVEEVLEQLATNIQPAWRRRLAK